MSEKEDQDDGPLGKRASDARRALGAGIRASENISALVTGLAPHLIGVLFHILPHAPQLALRFFKTLGDAMEKKGGGADDEEA